MLDTACTLNAYACCAEIFNLQLSEVESSQVLSLLIPKVRITWAVRLQFRVVSGFSHGPEPLANLKRGLQRSGKPSFSSVPPNLICSWTFFRGLMGVKSINVTWSYLFYILCSFLWPFYTFTAFSSDRSAIHSQLFRRVAVTFHWSKMSEPLSTLEKILLVRSLVDFLM